MQIPDHFLGTKFRIATNIKISYESTETFTPYSQMLILIYAKT